MEFRLNREVFLIWFCLVAFLCSAERVLAASQSTEPDQSFYFCRKTIPQRAAVQVIVREFERRPSFQQFDRKLPPELLDSQKILSADLDCAGRKKPIFFNPTTRKIFSLRFDPLVELVELRAIGVLPAELDWDNVRVGRVEKGACDSLFVPKPKGRELYSGASCGEDPLRWFKFPLPEGLAEASVLYPLPDNESEGFELFGTEKSASILFSAHGSRWGGRIDRVVANPLDGWRWLGFRLDAQFRRNFVLRHPELTILLSGGPENRKTFSSAPRTFRFLDPQLADLNGDGRTELILPGAASHGSWVVLPYGEGMLEMPNNELSLLLHRRPISSVGDYDGDGLEDLLFEVQGRLLFILTKPGKPIVGAEVFASGALFRTNNNGVAEIFLPKENTVDVRLLNESRVVFSPELRREHDQALRENFVFLVDLERKHSENAELHSKNSEERKPSICLGYTTGANNTNWNRQSECPDGYAFFDQDDGSLPAGTCCPLPEEDVLAEEEIFTEDRCPPDSIATGVYWDPEREPGKCPGCFQKLRCRRLNREKYTLSRGVAGVQYGDRSSVSFSGEEMSRNDLPVALRWGVGRVDLSSLDSDGCVGNPPASVLVGRKGRRCHEMEFAEILRRTSAGRSGSPARLKMYPDCRSLVDIYDPSQGCEVESR